MNNNTHDNDDAMTFDIARDMMIDDVYDNDYTYVNNVLTFIDVTNIVDRLRAMRTNDIDTFRTILRDANYDDARIDAIIRDIVM